jgi:Fe-S-cluster containining protein
MGKALNKNYQDLLEKVDQKFAEISEQESAQMRCGEGCHQCCLPGLNISKVEAQNIGEAVNAAGIGDKLMELKVEDPWEGARCSLLDRQGMCSIYSVRPIICRSHGAPIRFRKNEELAKDVCELNFVEKNLDKVSEDHFINIELLNTLLALINAQAFPGDSEARIPLEINAILNFCKTKQDLV